MVHAERPAAERPAPRRTASFARMIENTREAPRRQDPRPRRSVSACDLRLG
jgi:hypothetical protein